MENEIDYDLDHVELIWITPYGLTFQVLLCTAIWTKKIYQISLGNNKTENPLD